MDYGEPASGNEHKKIFYKDFECELFIGSALIKNGLKPELLEDPDDPRGDIKLDNIFIEVKHLNSAKQTTKLMRKFNKEMRQNGSYGIFVSGVEDMFNMGDKFSFKDQSEFDVWNYHKRSEMDKFAREEIIPSAHNLHRILGLVQTSTNIYEISGKSDLKRLGNSMLLLRQGIPADDQKNAEAIVKVFNPNPPAINCERI